MDLEIWYKNFQGFGNRAFLESRGGCHIRDLDAQIATAERIDRSQIVENSNFRVSQFFGDFEPLFWF